MMTGTFAAWVEPIASRLRESREEIVRLARAFPADAWRDQSSLAGWSYRDILCHLAVGDFFCQAVVTAVVSGGDLDLRPLSGGRDARNDKLVGERRDRTVAELIEEVEAEGAKTQQLLSRLTDGDVSAQIYVSNRKPVPTSLSDYLTTFSSHDEEHILQLLKAAEGSHVA